MTEPTVSQRSPRRVRPLAAGLALAVVVVLAATVAWVVSRGHSASSASPAATSSEPSASPTAGEKGPVTIRWFIGLGNSGQPNQIEAARDFVERFNETHKDVVLELVLGLMDPESELENMMSAGDAPEIVGPTGAWGRRAFEHEFMDLTPLIASHDVDTSAWEPGLLQLLNEGRDGLIGLPYLINPAFIFYNKDIFARAGLPDLPRHVGETYLGKPWDWNTLTDIAARLTLDEKGRQSTDPAFDSSKIAQWGMDFQWWDGRRIAAVFGAGSLVNQNGDAQIPAVWREAWNRYYDAIWSRHIVPTGDQIASKLLNESATVSSGRIAMSANHTWAINSYAGYNPDGRVGKPAFKTWDMAVMPSWKGQTTGPLDTDIFVIPKDAAHHDEAFEVMLAIMADPEVAGTYSGVPAVKSLRAAYYARKDADLAKLYPGNQVSWGVLDEMVGYPAIPGHDASMPNHMQSVTDFEDFFSMIQKTPGLDLDAELDALRSRLQADFDADLSWP
jgi:multiple sugar transport system substrate-binding protein